MKTITRYKITTNLQSHVLCCSALCYLYRVRQHYCKTRNIHQIHIHKFMDYTGRDERMVQCLCLCCDRVGIEEIAYLRYITIV